MVIKRTPAFFHFLLSSGWVSLCLTLGFGSCLLLRSGTYQACVFHLFIESWRSPTSAHVPPYTFLQAHPDIPQHKVGACWRDGRPRFGCSGPHEPWGHYQSFKCALLSGKVLPLQIIYNSCITEGGRHCSTHVTLLSTFWTCDKLPAEALQNWRS